MVAGERMRETSLFQLWADPLVCVITAGGSLQAGLELALAHAAGRRCRILARPSWDLDAIGGEIAEAARRLAVSHPNISLVALAPTAADAAMMVQQGVEAVHASNAAFIDERLYRPVTSAPKAFDALHNAQTGAFKRHELALGVPRVALITYDEKRSSEKIGALAARYRDLKFVNWTVRDGYRGLDPGEISALAGQASCGLLLSEVEGPNNACVEYQLCGLPLVTTPARGGREALYDPRFVSIVEPRPEAVEAAVAAWVARPADPWAVREAVLAAMRPHRARLIAWLSGIVGRDLMAEANENLWLPQFHDKLRHRWRYEIGQDGALEMELIERW
jgi:hypothetical protein